MLQQPTRQATGLNSFIDSLEPSIRKHFALSHDDRYNVSYAPISVFIFKDPRVSDPFDNRGTVAVLLTPEGILHVRKYSQADALNLGIMPSLFMNFLLKPKAFTEFLFSFFNVDSYDDFEHYNVSSELSDYDHDTVLNTSDKEQATLISTDILRVFKTYCTRVIFSSDRIFYSVSKYFELRDLIKDFLALYKQSLS